MSTYTQDINNLINIIETNIPDNTSQAIKAKNVRDAMESIAYNYDLYALKTDLDGKQDVLVSGENIKTINDASILGPGNIEISGGATLVECTQAEYEEMEQAGTLDPNAIYIITDAQPQNFVSKSELDAMSYITMSDVSACGYITTNDVSQMGYITFIPEEYATYDAISQMGYITNSALNGYATESYVVEKINEIPVVDLSSYVTKDYLSNQGYITSIPSEYITESELDSILSSYITESELDGMGYATQAYVMDRISEIPGTDLSSYVTKDYLSQQAYLQSIPSEYITESELNSILSSYITGSELNGMGYVTNTQLNDTLGSYITQEELSANGYLTQHQSLDGYATQSYVQNYVSSYGGTKVVEVTQAEYEEMEQAGTLDPDVVYIITDAQPQNVVTHDELSNMSYATQAYVMDRISEIPTADLSSYVTKDYLSNQGYITSIPDEYITQTELSANGYLTSSSLNGYATQSYVQNYVSSYGGTKVVEVTQAQYDAMEQAGTLDPDVVYIITDAQPQNVVTHTELEAMSYVTQEYLSNQGYITSIPDEYITQTELSANGYLTSIPSEYITDTELSGMGYLTQAQLSSNGYLTSIPSEYVTQTQLSANGYLTSSSLTDYATKSYVENYVASYAGSGSVVSCTQAQYDAWQQAGTLEQDTIYVITDSNPHDLSYYVEKTELYAMSYATQTYVADYVSEHAGPVDLTAYVTHDELNQAGYLTSIPSEYVTQTELSANGYLTSIPSEYITDTELSGMGYLTQAQLSSNGYLTSIPSEYVTQTQLSANGYLTSIPSDYVTESELSGMSYATQTYVADYVASHGGGGSTVIDENIIPNTTKTYTLGDASHLYAATYTDNLHIDTAATLAYSDNTIISYNAANIFGNQDVPMQLSAKTSNIFKINGTSKVCIDSASLRPMADGGTNLGRSDRQWGVTYTESLYLNGSDIQSYFAGLAKVHELSYDEYNRLSYIDQHNGDIYVLTDRQYDFDPSYYVTVADLNAASYVSTSYIEANYYSKSYVDSNFVSKTYLESYYVSKTELTAAGYLTSANFDYDSNNNTLKIII